MESLGIMLRHQAEWQFYAHSLGFATLGPMAMILLGQTASAWIAEKAIIKC
jgi:hypothetical protein